MRPRRLIFFLPVFFLLAFDSSLAVAQFGATLPSGVQSGAPDAVSFIKSAIETTNLTSPGTKPWHLRARYQQLDEKGAVKHQGTFEVWWAAPDSSKSTFTSPEFTRTTYRAGNLYYVRGDAGREPWIQNKVSSLVLAPLTFATSMTTEKDQTFGGVTFQCYSDEKPGPVGELFCFKDALPVPRLVISTQGGAITAQTSFNGIVRLHEHYLAKTIRLYELGTLLVQVDIDVVDPALTIDEAERSHLRMLRLSRSKSPNTES
ncbi:MAG TPA: hypothetical protein VGD59_02130 [Acidisarcina sp.]